MKPSLQFKIADPVRDRDCLLALNAEYMAWSFVQVEKAFGIDVQSVVGMPVKAYVESVIDEVCGNGPPESIFYLIEFESELVAMGGLRRVREGVSELKRVYVRPAYRRRQIGAAIVGRLITDARTFGFKTMLLDSGPFMKSAHRMYEAFNFKDCPAYPEAEVPTEFHLGWRFMQREL